MIYVQTNLVLNEWLALNQRISFLVSNHLQKQPDFRDLHAYGGAFWKSS